jgi:hypothetical protein
MGSIYKIEFPNEKHYIGITTTTLEQRKKEHKKCAKSGDTNCILYNALRRHNTVDTFELIEIDTADTKEELCKKEIDYIQKYNSYYMNGCGYNMTLGGEGTNGYVFTEDDKKKMSEAQIKYSKTPGAREKYSESQKKRFETPGAREKHGELKKIYIRNHPEEIQKMRERMIQYNKEHPDRIKQILDKKGQNKPFDVLKIDGTFIKTFTYQFDAVNYLRKEYNITSTIKISEVLLGQRKSSAGFVFKYKSNEEE